MHAPAFKQKLDFDKRYLEDRFLKSFRASFWPLDDTLLDCL